MTKHKNRSTEAQADQSPFADPICIRVLAERCGVHTTEEELRALFDAGMQPEDVLPYLAKKQSLGVQ